MSRLAIIGGGFMGAALAEGLLDSGWHRDSFVVAEISRDRREHLTARLKLRTTDSAAEAAAQAATVLLAVKPQNARDTLAAIRPVFDRAKLLVSICAGIRIETLEQALGNPPVIRTMPNTPAAVGTGVTALARGRHATDQHLATALNILSAVGRVVVVDESQMDAVTAVSGTGPAYVFYLAEALIDAACAEGLDREQATMLVYQTFVGAAHLLQHDPAGPVELRRRVTSPNGTTHAAITHLQAANWAETFRQAVTKARRRAEELGRS
ncbi:MAG: pyrroline-5-carboxylate reductase [Planctomycetes bacterium]|nr:pyrroline-5-carboxylate reductase [Planctomycetota bacterium]